MEITSYGQLSGKTEFTHLDKPAITGYVPRKNVTIDYNRLIIAKSGLGIVLPREFNQQFSLTKGPGYVHGQLLRDFIISIPTNILFYNQIKPTKNEIDWDFYKKFEGEKRLFFEKLVEENLRKKVGKKSSTKPGNFHKGRDSEAWKILTSGNNAELLKNSIINSINRKKLYRVDEDLLKSAEDLYLCAFNIHPVLAAAFTEFRQVQAFRKDKNKSCSLNYNQNNQQNACLYHNSNVINYSIATIGVIDYNTRTLIKRKKTMNKTKIINKTKDKLKRTGGDSINWLIISKFKRKSIEKLYEIRVKFSHFFSNNKVTYQAFEASVKRLIKNGKVAIDKNGLYYVPCNKKTKKTFNSSKKYLLNRYNLKPDWDIETKTKTTTKNKTKAKNVKLVDNTKDIDKVQSESAATLSTLKQHQVPAENYAMSLFKILTKFNNQTEENKSLLVKMLKEIVNLLN